MLKRTAEEEDFARAYHGSLMPAEENAMAEDGYYDDGPEDFYEDEYDEEEDTCYDCGNYYDDCTCDSDEYDDEDDDDGWGW